MKKAYTYASAITLLGSISILMAACASHPVTRVSQGTVIQNVTVVNTRDGSLAPSMSVVILEGRIQTIVPSAAIATSGSTQVIDATGNFVVPGFLDMHAHTMAFADQTQTYWPLLIANGITGIREMSGSAAAIKRTRQLNLDSKAGKVDAPEILQISGELFRGQVATAAGATLFLQEQKAAGADFFKLIAGNRESVLAILAEAKVQGLDVAGHLSPSVSALESSNAGWKSIEHLGAGMGLMLDCANDEAAIRSALSSGQGARGPFPPTSILSPRIYDGALNAPFYQRVQGTYNEIKCQALAQAFVKNRTWQVPTLIRARTQIYGDALLYTNDPNLQYLDKTTRALWAKLGKDFTFALPATAVATLRRYYDLHLSMTKMMKQSGVKMLTGSDVGGIWVIPGFSLHQEFRELATAGLTPLEILQMTTLNGAEFMKREATMGTVEVGKNADLVLLEANPIADVVNLSKINGVFLRGKYFSKSALDQLKSTAAQAQAQQPLKSLSSAIDTSHVH
jgi:imidazolonepropionase-like amidohydrolase